MYLKTLEVNPTIKIIVSTLQFWMIKMPYTHKIVFGENHFLLMVDLDFQGISR